MRKTYCDVCGEETRWDKSLSIPMERNIMLTVKVSASKFVSPYHDLTGFPQGIDICFSCFARAVEDAAKKGTNR